MGGFPFPIGPDLTGVARPAGLIAKLQQKKPGLAGLFSWGRLVCDQLVWIIEVIRLELLTPVKVILLVSDSVSTVLPPVTVAV